MKKLIVVISALLAMSAPSFAGSKSVTLAVPGMTCELCPATVKKALSKVPGVSSVAVSFEKREAVVSFDDSKVSVDALTNATTNVGYPSTVK